MDNKQYLPSLNDKDRMSPGNPGTWRHEAGITYFEVADSLARPEVGQDTTSISSIPDMWARPLLVNMVLRDDEHPLHSSIKAQWKGMLAVIALAEVQSFKLKAEFIDLEQYKTDSFVRALLELCPPAQKTIYQLEEKNKNPWEKIYIFMLNEQSIGIVSPTTLICASEEGDFQSIPWFEEGRLNSPVFPKDHLTEDDKIQLYLWLENLLDQLNKQTGEATKIKDILIEYQEELLDMCSSDVNTQRLRLSKNEQYFGVSIKLGKLDALSVPIQAKKIESSVTIQFLGRNSDEKVYFIPDTEDILDQWSDQQPKYIWIYDTNILTFNRSEFERKFSGKIKFLTEEDIFEDQFYFLEGSGNLPGALLPEGIDEITYDINEVEHRLTPLLPLKSEILNYFSPQELIQRLELQPATIGNQSGVRVKLTLSLSGGDYTIKKDYPIKENNTITAKPFLEIWPNFKAPNWKTYYSFYFDNRSEATRKNKTFHTFFAEAKEVHPPEHRDFQITLLEDFPDYITCKDDDEITQGLILIKPAPTVGDQSPSKTWTVGVDFGTSFTNVYYQINKLCDSLTLSPLHLQVTEAGAESSRNSLLYDYFISANLENFPLSSVLTIKGTKEKERPIFDGRIYILEDIPSFDPIQDDIKTNLKWKPENLPYNRTFLKHLALQIAAEAAKNHVRHIDWSISYPSAFSRSDKNLYKVTWQQIIESLGEVTGIEHKWITKGRPYSPESLALAHYFADEEGKDLVYTTCIDMGGGTSDISIWLGNRLIHQCSVQLAGRLLFSQFWKRKPDFLDQQFNSDLFDLAQELRDDPFYVKLDGVLAAEGDNWLKRNRALMDDNSDLQAIVQLSALGISGLYYYIGLVLQALELEGLYPRKQNTPVYIGGNGSRILNWLDLSGKFSQDCDAAILLSQMFSKGSGFDDTQEATILSTKPKAEVACGLVLDQTETRLTGLEQEEDDIFAGEDCEVNGERIEWRNRLNLMKFGEINSFSVSGSDYGDLGLTNLKQFLEDYHTAFQEKRIVSIKPLEKYEDVQWQQKLWSNVSRKLEANLTTVIGRKAEEVRIEPPFILGLKALLKELCEQI